MILNSFEQNKLQNRALTIAGNYLKFEAELITVLQELDSAKTYLFFEQPSLFSYTTKILKLSESVALTLIAIARKAKQVPELKQALIENKITVSNARRITAIINQENKSEWIAKAAELPQAKLDLELARAFPERCAAPNKIKLLSATQARVELNISQEALALLKKAQQILAQKKQSAINESQALELVLAEFVERYDKVSKAKRALKSQSPKVNHAMQRPEPTKTDSTPSDSIESEAQTTTPTLKKLPVVKRIAINSQTKHQLFIKEKNQCSYINHHGQRCENQQWLAIHHRQPIAEGGNNELNNLELLCAAHHKMIHNLMGA